MSHDELIKRLADLDYEDLPEADKLCIATAAALRELVAERDALRLLKVDMAETITWLQKQLATERQRSRLPPEAAVEGKE